MISGRHPLEVSPAALLRLVELRLPGAPLATFVALLASLDQTGLAAITQPELRRLLDSSPGRVWQSLQALVVPKASPLTNHWCMARTSLIDSGTTWR